jgi:hypothetical protein
VFGRIEGDLNSQFKIAEIGLGPTIDWHEDQPEAELTMSDYYNNFFPPPYGLVFMSYANDMRLISKVTVGIKMQEMVDALNKRREELLRNLEYIDELQRLAKSLELGKKILSKL